MTTTAAKPRALPYTLVTDGNQRRLGKYHHGKQTKVAGVRLPIEKYERSKGHADRRGESFSEYLEYLIDTAQDRKR